MILRRLISGVVVLSVVYGGFQIVGSHAAAATSVVKSGIRGYCLDTYKDSTAANAIVDSWRCNNSQAQNWTVNGSSVSNASTRCLSVLSDSKKVGAPIVSTGCNQTPGQVWLSDKTGLLNPNSGLCLAALTAGKQLVLASCSQVSSASETWTYKSNNTSDDAAAACSSVNTEGLKVACVAEHEWALWNGGTVSHQYLLNRYTNGYGYEEWCADFVSYVYKQAGFPFTGGESDGWDENIAGNIQNMGFSLHPAASYIPKAGDVAFFDYPGGHVEIVVSGGKTPTFIYGDSGTKDPISGNGDMATNTITGDADGSVTYYLSPN